MESPLLHFLSKSRSMVLDASRPATNTYVLGNPSADLDSFISAVVFSFCYDVHQKDRTFVPLINLSAVPSSDLWRLRPEFGTALRLAVDSTSSSDDKIKATEKQLLQPNVLTIHDLQDNKNTKSLFPADDAGLSPASHLDVVLVDHNAPAIPNVASSSLSSLNLVACVDHHEDESKVPSSASPRIIKTGIGSCTSLIVQHLRDENMWPFPTSTQGAEDSVSSWNITAKELSLLALAPILIDTANLTAPGKVSDLDREIVSYLEDIIKQADQKINTSAKDCSPTTFNREDFYTQISTSKASSLDNLTIPETLDRDYKEWTEQASSPSSKEEDKTNIKIGISSSVKPISYLLSKSLEGPSSSPQLLPQTQSFSSEKNLDIYILMTAFTSSSEEFQREILILPTSKSKATRSAIEKFLSEDNSSKLKLGAWPSNASEDKDQEETKSFTEKIESNGGKVYVQSALEMSRKQIAPMIRECC